MVVTQLEIQLGLRLFLSGGVGGYEIEYTAKAQLQLGLQAAWLSLAIKKKYYWGIYGFPECHDLSEPTVPGW